MSILYIGESFYGLDNEGNFNAAHTNVIIGEKNGAAGTALTTAMATPRQGYIPFMAIHAPNIPVKPATLFAAKAEISGELHGNATWGAAQAGVARGVLDAVEKEIITEEMQKNWCIIACVWVNPSCNDLDIVYVNQRQAMYEAIERAFSGYPTSEDIAHAKINFGNPFYTPKNS